MQQKLQKVQEGKDKMRGILQFKEDNYKVLKSVDFSEMKDDIVFNDEKSEIELSNLELFEIILNEEIVSKGMDSQDAVNDYGRSLYNIYDEMLEQCE